MPDFSYPSKTPRYEKIRLKPAGCRAAGQICGSIQFLEYSIATVIKQPSLKLEIGRNRRNDQRLKRRIPLFVHRWMIYS